MFFPTKWKTARYECFVFHTPKGFNWQLNAVFLFERLFSYSMCLVSQVFLWSGGTAEEKG